MTETLNIKAGDWAVLRNGEVRGPLSIVERTMFPIEEINQDGVRVNAWRSNGFYIVGGPTDLDIVDTIPAAPADHIRALEARAQKLEQALQKQIAFYAIDLACLKQLRDPDKDQIADIEYRRDDARQALEDS